MPTFALGGSRNLSSHPAIAPVVQAALAAGHTLRVGCCTGADALVIRSALAAHGAAALRVFAQFAPGGAGACSVSAVGAVAAALAAGASVRFCAGGPVFAAGVQRSARLIRRSQAVIAGAQALVLFAPGAGALSVAALAAAAGTQVFAFGSLAAPVCAGGAWAPSSLFGLPCWAWQPAQASLF